jgi:hypothetical protein
MERSDMAGSDKDTKARPGPEAGRFCDRPSFRDRRLQRLAAHLPRGLRSAIHGLRRPSARWVRLPAALLFLVGGTILTPLPLFGLWMLPVGLVLVAEDIPLVRTWVVRALDTLEKHRPGWLRRQPRR